jgi:hypothetical protein
LEAVVGFFVGFEGKHIDRFHSFHPFLEQADLGLEGFGWEFGEFGGDYIRFIFGDRVPNSY